MEIERFVSDLTTPPAFEAVRGIPELPVEPLASGVACLAAYEGGRPVARLSLHLREGLHGAPGRTGLVGHYEALEAGAGAALLIAANRELAERGAIRVLGPMNGSTWMRYRLALRSEPGDPVCDPPYFTAEPRNPFDYPDHFTAAGFRICARYRSALDDLSTDVPDAEAVAARVAGAGVSLRPLDREHFDDELGTLHALSCEAFADNLYYTPIDEAGFRALYRPLLGRMDPELVQIVLDRERTPCGYLFAFTDPASVRDGRAQRLIVKTVAVAPRVRGQGIANLMLDQARATARARGCREVVHALMHVANASTRMSSRHGGRMFRRYALWEWTP